MKQLTIFTPTYNRAYSLLRLYNSMLKQDTSCFKWLIVDDGSTDNTRDLVSEWIKENKIEIRYIYQKNAGKMQAHNVGVLECDTELFLCCDSDDWMVEYSIKPALEYWNSYQKKLFGMASPRIIHQKELSGMVSPRYHQQKELSGRGAINVTKCPIDLHSVFSKDLKTCTLEGLYEKGYHGETALIFRTEVIRMYPFPKIEGEKFITEDYIYCQLDEKYELLVYPKYCMYCEYQNDGYTKNIAKIAEKNPKGYALYANEKVKHAKSKWEILYRSYDYFLFSRKGKVPFMKIISKASFPMATLVSIPLFSTVRKLKAIFGIN